MSAFKGRHFEGEIVLWAVRWYCRYAVSYRDLEEMMGERGVRVDHSTIYRWVQNMPPRWKSAGSVANIRLWSVQTRYVTLRLVVEHTKSRSSKIFATEPFRLPLA